MRLSILKDILAGIFFILIQVFLFQHLSIFGTTPDLLLIFILWLALKYDRLQLILFAAGLSFLQDALFDLWGLHMFSKVLLGFFSYNLLNKSTESRLLAWQVITIVFAASFVHNLIFLGLSSFIDAYTTAYSPWMFLIGNSVYTAVVGSVLFIFKGQN